MLYIIKHWYCLVIASFIIIERALIIQQIRVNHQIRVIRRFILVLDSKLKVRWLMQQLEIEHIEVSRQLSFKRLVINTQQAIKLLRVIRQHSFKPITLLVDIHCYHLGLLMNYLSFYWIVFDSFLVSINWDVFYRNRKLFLNSTLIPVYFS